MTSMLIEIIFIPYVQKLLAASSSTLTIRAVEGSSFQEVGTDEQQRELAKLRNKYKNKKHTGNKSSDRVKQPIRHISGERRPKVFTADRSDKIKTSFTYYIYLISKGFDLITGCTTFNY